MPCFHPFISKYYGIAGTRVRLMHKYKLKRGHSADLERIREVMKDCFPSPVKENGGRLQMSYGAFKSMEAWFEGKEMCVETSSVSSINDSEILDTNRRFRNFLQEATGYTSKQRQQMAKKGTQG